MSKDSLPTPPAAQADAPVLPRAPWPTKSMNPARVRAAVTEPTRLRMLWALAEGAVGSVDQMATAVGCRSHMASKHLTVLWQAGVIVVVHPPDGDGRRVCYQIPAVFRIRDTDGRPALDFGCIVLRRDGAL